MALLSIYSDEHRLHAGQAELVDGRFAPCFESPQRADLVLEAVKQNRLGEVIAPTDFGLEPVCRVHDQRYVDFLHTAWELWSAEGRDWDALPLNWAVRGMRQIEPEHIDGKLSYFSFDAGTPITAGTWKAVTAAANVALTGAHHVLADGSTAFSLCRPPGHHAAADYYGGYCFLNNAAIGAQYFLDNGAARVAILDIDYHHGNGTQSIFYDRDDVLYVSIHGDPEQEFPFFLGRADERGSGPGEGCNANYPLRWQSSPREWFAALDQGLQQIAAFAPHFLVVSLGVDAYVDDPISQFRLESDDFLTAGSRIGDLDLPVLFVLEGGYAIDAIGTNVANVLLGAQ